MTEVARLLLDGIDEDAIDFRENYSGDERAGRAARRLPEPARQWLAGHRGRHGDLDPAAQSRRICDAALHLIAQSRSATATTSCNIVPGPDFPTGGVIIESREHIAEAYRTGPRRLPPARALERRGGRARHLGRSSSPRFPMACRNRG
jgi:topoisomerase-4 subunit A